MCTNEAHEELREVFVRGFLVGNQGLRVDWDFFDLRDVMMLMRPDLVGRRILLVHHSDTLEGPRFDLQGRELLPHALYEPFAVRLFTGSLEVIDMGALNEYQSLGRFLAIGRR